MNNQDQIKKIEDKIDELRHEVDKLKVPGGRFVPALMPWAMTSSSTFSGWGDE